MSEDSSRHTRTALVTGATRGIGFELAALLARDRYDLVLVGRNREQLSQNARQLESQHGIRVRVLAKDLSASNAADGIVDALRADMVGIDVLLNNAGFGWNGRFVESDLAEQLSMIQVNVTALMHLTRLLLPAMVARRSGRILNVASTAAFYPGPMMATYYASKAFVLSFSEALAEELRGTGVTVTALCPGPTRTGFQARAGMGNSRRVKSLFVMDAATVAAAGYRALHNGKRVCVPGVLNRLMTMFARILPKAAVLQILRNLHKR